MTAQPTSVPLSVVPDAQTQNGIQNTIDAPRKLAEVIEAFRPNRADTYRSSPPKQKEERVRQNLRLFGKVAAQERYVK